MKVICERQALLTAVNNVASVVPSRTPSPALSCLKLVATKTAGISELLLSGTDNETSLQLSITQVDVTQPGTAVVPADKLRQKETYTFAGCALSDKRKNKHLIFSRLNCALTNNE